MNYQTLIPDLKQIASLCHSCSWHVAHVIAASAQLREDSQMDFSRHNVKWALSPDPSLLSIMSTDKNPY